MIPATSAATPSVRRYGGKSADERRAERREQLLDAALELFGTTGFRATTIEALCSAASLHPRYFYEQFATREQLLGAVYDRHVSGVLSQVQAAIAGASDEPGERLRTGLAAFVEATLADERGARINYFEMVGVSTELEARRRSVLRAYAELIADEAARLPDPGALARGDRRMAAMALVGATDGLLIDWLTSERRVAQRSLVDTLVAIFAS